MEWNLAIRRWLSSMWKWGRMTSGRPAANARRRKGTTDWGHVDQLEPRQVLTVTYHGGALLTSVEAQAVYLGTDWNSNPTLQNEQAQLDQFLAYLVKSPYMDMLTQAGYNVGEGTATAGAVDNVRLSGTVTDNQIQSYLQGMITSSTLAPPDANRLYVVYVPPGVAVNNGSESSTTTFLGYHGAFRGKDANGQAVDIHYDVLPYPGSPNPSPASQGFSSAFDQLTSVTSHELAEAVTDPNVNYKTVGWYDDRLNGEIGDLTRQTTTLNGYVVQDLVGKNDQVISPTAVSPNPSPNPPSTVSAPQNVIATATSSTSVTLTWSGTTNAASYRIYQANGNQWSLLGSVSGSSTSVQVTGLTPGTTASFVVESVNGTAFADSAVATVQLPAAALSSPTVFGSATSSTTAILSWGSVSGALGYNIYIWDGHNSVLLGTVNASTTSVQISGLTPGGTYRFRVEAFDETSAAVSGWVTIVTPVVRHSRGRFNPFV